LKEIAKSQNPVFIRVSPIEEKNKENELLFKNLGFKKAALHIHPELTWELNIDLPEEDILLQMRKTTRYLIRQAQKNTDIRISRGQSSQDFEKFGAIYHDTVRRHHFVPFPPDYLEKEMLAFKNDSQIEIFLGHYQNQTVSGAIIVYWGKVGFYHHGASSQKFAKIPVSYLLQWEAIKEAKKRGCKIYNFWGIAPKGKKKHPWAGLTVFKQGFGGYEKQYLPTQDLALRPGYWVTYLIEKIRKVKRRL